MYGNQPPGGGGYGGPPGGGGYGGPPGGGGYGGPPGQPPGGGGYGAPPGQPPGGGYGAPPGQPPGGYGAPPGGPMMQPGYGPPGMMPGMNPMAAGPGKSKMVTILLAIIPSMFGICGIHRFYTGHVVIGILQFLTVGGCGIWQLIDLIFIFTGKYTDSNGRPLMSDSGVPGM